MIDPFNSTAIKVFQKRISNPFLFRITLYRVLPLASLTGVRLMCLNEELAELSVRYKFINKNPFKTTYWAVLGMCAELASGLLLLMYTHKLNPSISTFVLGCEAKFVKRAIGKTTFVCNQGAEISKAVQLAINSKEPQDIRCVTNAYNEDGELVAEFVFIWGIKVRSQNI